MKILDFYIQGLGYESSKEFLESIFHVSIIKKIMFVGVSMGSLATLIEDYLGIAPLVYLFFMILIVGEIWSGVMASREKGVKIQSRKGGRMIIKMGIYTLIIGGLYQMSLTLDSPKIPVLNISVDIWSWVYYIVLNMIILQLLISVLENLHAMGYKETSNIVRILDKLLNKWFELKREDK